MREREGEARKGSKKIGMEQVAKGKDCWSKQIIIDEGARGTGWTRNPMGT